MLMAWVVGAIALSEFLARLLGYTRNAYRISLGILGGSSVCLAGLFLLLENAPILHSLFMVTMFVWWGACIYGVRYFFMVKQYHDTHTI